MQHTYAHHPPSTSSCQLSRLKADELMSLHVCLCERRVTSAHTHPHTYPHTCPLPMASSAVANNAGVIRRGVPGRHFLAEDYSILG